jgi:hypothetical protein
MVADSEAVRPEADWLLEGQCAADLKYPGGCATARPHFRTCGVWPWFWEQGGCWVVDSMVVRVL